MTTFIDLQHNYIRYDVRASGGIVIGKNENEHNKQLPLKHLYRRLQFYRLKTYNILSKCVALMKLCCRESFYYFWFVLFLFFFLPVLVALSRYPQEDNDIFILLSLYLLYFYSKNKNSLQILVYIFLTTLATFVYNYYYTCAFSHCLVFSPFISSWFLC